MKILTVSDRVDNLLYSEQIGARLGDVDAVLSCGDLPPYYLEYIVTMLNVPLFYVFGNHGGEAETASPEQSAGSPAGCMNIDNRVVNYRGLLIAGLEGSMRYNRRARFQYSESDMRMKIIRLTPRLLWNRIRRGRYLDILITHAPPCGIHDAEDVCHRGFKGYIQFMDRYSPRYLIHGHTHVYFPSQAVRTMYKNTEVVNTYGYRILEIDVPQRRPSEKTEMDDIHV